MCGSHHKNMTAMGGEKILTKELTCISMDMDNGVMKVGGEGE